MKKLILLTLCSLLLFTGCSGKKEEENKPIDNENKEPTEIEKPIPEINNQIIVELNGMLLESGSEQQLVYVSKEISGNDINYVYQADDNMKLTTTFDKEYKLKHLKIEAPIYKSSPYNYYISEDYTNAKLFLIKLPCLNILKEDFNQLLDCTTGAKIGFCETSSKNFMALSVDESAFTPTFSLYIYNLNNF